MRNLPELLVEADKSRNIYKIKKDHYNKILLENVTKTYKKSNSKKVDAINKEGKRITTNLNIADRVEKLKECEAYITIKDHKEGFPNRIQCRLINPTKGEIGKISKQVLDRINSRCLQETKYNQWKNTKSVTDWFNNLDKRNCTFVVFDIESFYPSITPKLFQNSLNFAKQYSTIDENEINIIMQARKSLLFHDSQPWSKKEGDEFDVPMGCFDGAEVCQMVGTFLLEQISKILPKHDVGLYRDDGLGVTRNMSGPKKEQLKKKLVKLFHENDLKITIKINVKITEFLDVELDISKGTYKPYRKPNNPPLYINRSSNHPNTILKEIPKMIAKRNSEISSNEAIFNESIGEYQSAIERSGFDEQLRFTETNSNNTQEKKLNKQRKRKIIWFNPPFSRNVKTNIGKMFFKILSKHFPQTSKFYKIFNKNTVKISYSCTRNMKDHINAHNRKILFNKEEKSGCNCRIKQNCPLQNNCLTPNIIYRADVSNDKDDEKKFYIGLTEPQFKDRYRNHTKSFKHAKYSKETELSKYIWSLKEDGKTATIEWSIVKKINTQIPRVNFCSLCLTEKLNIIMNLHDNSLLNKKTEIVSKCRHINKNLFKFYKNDSYD